MFISYANKSTIGSIPPPKSNYINHQLSALLQSGDTPPRLSPDLETMGPKRATRASSRASSAGPSAPPTPVPAATPRRTQRKLPSVNTRESTSYGTSIAAVPSEIARRELQRDLTSTLADILGPAQQNFQNGNIHEEPVAGTVVRGISPLSLSEVTSLIGTRRR